VTAEPDGYADDAVAHALALLMEQDVIRFGPPVLAGDGWVVAEIEREVAVIAQAIHDLNRWTVPDA
jgi:hypothetical protein